jgi:hypothetical protein
MSTRVNNEIQFSQDSIQPAPRLLETTGQEPSLTNVSGLYTHLSALRSFFNVRNHPIPEVEFAEVANRDWTAEMHIASAAVLECVQFTLSEINFAEKTNSTEAGKGGEANEFAAWCASENDERDDIAERHTLLCDVADLLCGMNSLLEKELQGGKVDLYAFSSFRTIVDRPLDDLKRKGFLGTDEAMPGTDLLKRVALTGKALDIDEQHAHDVSRVIAGLCRLLYLLKTVEEALGVDVPLKKTLPFFALVHEEARELLTLVERTARLAESVNEDLFNALDGMKFAVSMELRKVFSFELVGLSSLRQAPSIYARVENSHGLLRDSFQQSIVGLAQLFNPEISGVSLFNAFQTKFQQSISLRNDLWALLQLVRRAEKERDLYPIARLIESLNAFRDGSLRYLMFKDWEACERFIEEVGASRGAIELAPVLNRFSAYLETLHGQVNMRAVLAEHPFEYPARED